MINMKGEGNYYHCNLKQDFRKEIGKIKTETKGPQFGLCSDAK